MDGPLYINHWLSKVNGQNVKKFDADVCIAGLSNASIRTVSS